MSKTAIIQLINVFHILAITCVNDDSTEDRNGDTCSSVYKVSVFRNICGLYDTANFTSSVQCCACEGGNVTGGVE